MQPSQNNIQVGQNFKYHRLKSGYTLEEVGQRIGVHKSTVLRWEKGDNGNLKLPVIEALAKMYQITPAELMAWNDEQAQAAGLIPPSGWDRQTDQAHSADLKEDKAAQPAVFAASAYGKDHLVEQEKTSDRDIPASKARAIRLYAALIASGLIEQGQDITQKQLEVLDGISLILSALFDKQSY